MFDSMAACNADGVSMCDAHPDLEVFRLRLGKALNFEFNEDTQTGLFQRRDPREGQSCHLLRNNIFIKNDPNRWTCVGHRARFVIGQDLCSYVPYSIHHPQLAMNKLEKVALRAAPRREKPFVLIINNVHFFQNNDEGRHMLLQLQQRAEAWAASGLYLFSTISPTLFPELIPISRYFDNGV